MSPDPYDPERVATLSDPASFRYCSGEELRSFLDPGPGWHVADFGSGTGLFTDELAPAAGTVYAVDVRPGLHAAYRDRGTAANVVPMLADFGRLPFPDDHLDGGISVRTYHHGFDDVLGEIARVVRPGGRLVVVDWSATGAGDREGRDSHRYRDVAAVAGELLEAGFRIDDARERRETFVVVAVRR